jgi:rubrerythrin
VTATRRQLLLAAAPPGSDVEALERLLGLERRLEDAYAAALARDAVSPDLGGRLLEHEREHVRGVEQALGRRRPRATAPPPRSGLDFSSRRAFATAALRLEGEAVAAYVQVLATLRNERLRQPLGSIMACAAQHRVALRRALGAELL